MNKEEFVKLADELVKLGEDKEELLYWVDIFDDLDTDKQLELFVNLKQEIEDLKRIK